MVLQYHDGTKHHFHRYAQSLGYLDWATQPRPFRSFAGAPAVVLYPRPDALQRLGESPRITYDSIYGDRTWPPTPLTAAAIGDLLRHSLGLSAWKSVGASRWPLRVNPSSGNLHPTEAYVITPPLSDVSEAPAVWHYAPDRHVLEQRCELDAAAGLALGGEGAVFLIALTSIHWREAWKYGERAFRYCQHDLGHAVAALSLAAAIHGWHVRMVSDWSHDEIAALTGIDRDADYVDAEREEPACLLAVGSLGDGPNVSLAGLARSAHWRGAASQLSEDHVQWTFIDEVAEATHVADGRAAAMAVDAVDADAAVREAGALARSVATTSNDEERRLLDRDLAARQLILQRRSAVAFDGVSAMDRESFLAMLTRALPCAGAPWDAIWWPPHIHLAVFVHRVNGVTPGLYALARSSAAVSRLKAACDKTFAWQPAAADLPLFMLREGDHRLIAKRVSCHQDIAADGYFSLGMIADFESGLAKYGPSFYRQLFWESGVVGQVLYLESEAAGARGTGIGCFFDDAVHELLGLEGHAFQSLYHFTVGLPVEDGRLTTAPGYEWESGLLL